MRRVTNNGAIRPFTDCCDNTGNHSSVSSYASSTLLPVSVDACPKYNPPPATFKPPFAVSTIAFASCVREPAGAPANFCAACGFRIDRADTTLVHRFCSSCGHRLPGGGTADGAAATAGGGGCGTKRPSAADLLFPTRAYPLTLPAKIDDASSSSSTSSPPPADAITATPPPAAAGNEDVATAATTTASEQQPTKENGEMDDTDAYALLLELLIRGNKRPRLSAAPAPVTVVEDIVEQNNSE